MSYWLWFYSAPGILLAAFTMYLQADNGDEPDMLRAIWTCLTWPALALAVLAAVGFNWWDNRHVKETKE